MNRQERYAVAAERIAARRRQAELQQEMRTAEVYREIPESAEIDAQLRNACMHLLQAGRDPEQQAALMQMIQRRTVEAQNMMESVLVAHGYPADYLDMHYTCPDCNDTGLHNGERCRCFQQVLGCVGAEELSSRVSLDQYSFAAFSTEYYRDQPADAYEKMKKIFAFCKAYADDFTIHSQPLLMCGKTGLGKTHLSLAITGVVLSKGFSVIYDSAGSLLHRIEQEHFKRGAAAEADTLTQLLQCDLLVLDDFGTEFSTAFSRATVYTIVNERLTANKPIIINTNLTPEQIQQDYGDRIVSRLFASCKWLEFLGSDIRIRKMQRAVGNAP
ncbi:MAG: ATP-binding protein [Oscillospiraceae bacterium]|nr:ATP-binding protein [Oscillospiraceae bacterium]